MCKAYNCVDLFQKLTSRYLKRISQLSYCRKGRVAFTALNTDKTRFKPRQNRKRWQPSSKEGRRQRNLWLEPALGEPINPYLSALRVAELVGQKSEGQILVDREGIEPPTQGFSALCSANWRAACVFSPGLIRIPLASFDKAPLKKLSAQYSLNPCIIAMLLF